VARGVVWGVAWGVVWDWPRNVTVHNQAMLYAKRAQMSSAKVTIR